MFFIGAYIIKTHVERLIVEKYFIFVL